MTTKQSAIVELTEQDKADMAKAREQFEAIGRAVDEKLEAYRTAQTVDNAKAAVLVALSLLERLALPGYVRPLVAGAVETLKLVIEQL